MPMLHQLPGQIIDGPAVSNEPLLEDKGVQESI